MGMNPNIWGSQGWHFIHAITLTYPNNPTEEDKEKYKTFFNSLPNVLPCSICGEHFKENLELMPLRLENQEQLFQWGVDMHNLVNVSNQKPTLTYDEAYRHFLQNSKKEKSVRVYQNNTVELFAGLAFSLLIINLFSK